MRILTVDDELVSRSKAEKILSQYGECDAAAGGIEGFQVFQTAHMNNKPYDIIFMDIRMDDIDGIEVLKQIRDHEARMNIPYDDRVKVVMLTSADNLESVMDSYAEECNAYIVKPFNKDKIIKAFQEAGVHINP